LFWFFQDSPFTSSHGIVLDWLCGPPGSQNGFAEP
jgi:hypothetical protein